MYVAPTPYALANGTAHRHTLIVPVSEKPGADFVAVGTLTRREVDNLVIYPLGLTAALVSTTERSQDGAET